MRDETDSGLAREVERLAALGLANAEIAERLEVDLAAVRASLAEIGRARIELLRARRAVEPGRETA